jgi:hypothetical protein
MMLFLFTVNLILKSGRQKLPGNFEELQGCDKNGVLDAISRYPVLQLRTIV